MIDYECMRKEIIRCLDLLGKIKYTQTVKNKQNPGSLEYIEGIILDKDTNFPIQ